MVSSDPHYFATAVNVAGKILQRLLDQPLAKDVLLNVNVPDLPWSDIKGFQVTRLGQRHKAEPVIKQQDLEGAIFIG